MSAAASCGIRERHGAWGRFTSVLMTWIVADQWVRELKSHEELFAKVGAKRPKELAREFDRLASHLLV